MTWRVFLADQLRFGNRGYKMYVARMENNERCSLLYSPTLHSIGQYESFPEGECFLDDNIPGADVRSFLQAMSDAAWEIGIKPKQLDDNTNELKAVRYHLEDMRQLAGVKK